LLEIINESIRINQSAANRHGVSLNAEPADEQNALRVIADKTRLKQVIINLLSNAIKYNQQNGSVFVSYDNIDEKRVKVLIRDTGKGISEAQQLKLFAPFERLGAESSSIEGTGIGLVITKTLVEHMGGEISVESIPGEGSTFAFTLATA
ncbi:MAG: ATP-binding protein, partial [Thioalkalispiraceae bacterium]|jgi:signal transduction histidine kinase